MIQILIIDDQALVRTGLRHILDQGSESVKVIEAVSGEAAIKRCRNSRPNVILLSINLPGLTGFEITRKLKRIRPGAGIIILAGHAKPPYPTRLMDAGASGYLTRDCEATELRRAVRIVAGGQRYIGSEAAKQLALSMISGAANGSPFEELSAREMEVMLKITDGSRIPDIASLMCLSPKTVSTYKYRILGKLGARSEVEMVRMAMRYGLVEGV
ncbi:MAG: response regulator [Xanthomonadales bacterium]|nr:response regulator [Gammaproteobacteria bacterium]MBT8073189.1 response regulator [Gammaproteobacteria bacterium]NNK04033.1 response regulator [Xanthomonadales bacterium]NNK97522.1 response regulator [Xanthomonadales bacterium]